MASLKKNSAYKNTKYTHYSITHFILLTNPTVCGIMSFSVLLLPQTIITILSYGNTVNLWCLTWIFWLSRFHICSIWQFLWYRIHCNWDMNKNLILISNIWIFSNFLFWMFATTQQLIREHFLTSNKYLNVATFVRAPNCDTHIIILSMLQVHTTLVCEITWDDMLLGNDKLCMNVCKQNIWIMY